SCDLNYRRTLWPPEKARAVMTELMPLVNVLIANEEHSALVLGVGPKEADFSRGPLEIERCKELANALHRRFNFQHVAITLREGLSASENGWSCLLSDRTNCYVSQKYRIWVVDRVGAGDAFSAGLIYGFLIGMGRQETVEFAAAAACLKHS